MSRASARWTLLLALVPTAAARAADPPAVPEAERVRVIVFGAHPDDAEYKAGGVAALWARAGHAVKLVSVTNGDIGHWDMAGGPLARRRAGESAAVRRERWDRRQADEARQYREGLAKWYGAERAAGVRHAEAFEVCEFGRQPTDAEIRRLFPFLPEP